MNRFTSVRILLVLALAAASFPALAATPEEAQKEVTSAGKTLDSFVADPEMTWFRNHAKDSRGLVICSQVTKAGFVLGGSGGRCVLVAKGDKGWNGPAFYSIGTASIGFQAGVSVAEIVMLVQTQKALDSLMSSAFKLGGDASIATGPVGVGAGADVTADFVAYSRAKGLYGGLNVSGSGIKPSEDYNRAYYGKDVSPIDIIAKGAVHNRGAEAALLSKVAKLYGGK
ncbi:MAG: lipid-binding SYLF domain-containing protein [Acidobacteriota bacterium]